MCPKFFAQLVLTELLLFTQALRATGLCRVPIIRGRNANSVHHRRTSILHTGTGDVEWRQQLKDDEWD